MPYEITSGELAKLRASGHAARIYLSVHHPATLLSAQVNDASIARGAQSIAYDNGSGTGFSRIKAGQTLWVGMSAGDCDVGRVRIRAITGNQTAGTIIVASNSIVWENGLYLTVKEEYLLWPRRPRITDAGVFYMDYDVAYSDQHSQPPPVAVAGPHRVGFLSSGSVTFNLDASDSYAIAPSATIAAYAWSCTGGTIANPSAASTTITFTSTGQYWLTLTVTDSNGKTQITHRLIFVHDRGSNYPYTNFELGQLGGGWEQGEWRMSVKVYGDADVAEFPDHAVVVLWQEAYYGGVKQDIGGVAGAKNVLFAGYIRKDSVVADDETGEVTFEATTLDGVLQAQYQFSLTDLEAVASPTHWYEYLNGALTVARALHYHLKWHTTVLEIADVFLPVSNTLQMPYCTEFEASAMYGQLEGAANEHGILAHVCCNKQGQVYIEEDAQVLSDTDRDTLPELMEVTSQDWIDEIEFQRRIEKQVMMVHVSGMSYAGVISALISQAPGDEPEDWGTDIIEMDGLVLESQEQANELVGRILARANNTFPEVRLETRHYGGVFDVVPQKWVRMTVAAGDTTRGIEWAGQRLLIRSVEIDFDAEYGALSARVTLEKEAEGVDGVTGDYTIEPAEEWPPLEPLDSPYTPPPPPPPPVWPPTTFTDTLVAFDSVNGCRLRTPDSSGWEERNSGRDAPADKADLQGGWDPWWFTPAMANTKDPDYADMWTCQEGQLWHTATGGRIWVNRDGDEIDDPPNTWADDPAPTLADLTFVQRVDSIHHKGWHCFLAEWQNPAGEWRGWLLLTTDGGLTWGWKGLIDVVEEGGSYWIPVAQGPVYCQGSTPPPSFDPVKVSSFTVSSPTTHVRSVVSNYTTRRWNFPGYYTYPDESWTAGGDLIKPEGGVSLGDIDGDIRCAGTGTRSETYTRDDYPTLNPGTAYEFCVWASGVDLTIPEATLYVKMEGLPPARPLWADVGTEAVGEGESVVMWLTLWKDGSLYLQKRTLPDLAWEWVNGVQNLQLGGEDITDEQLANKEYWAGPVTPLDDQDVCYVFGRMDAPCAETGGAGGCSLNLTGIQHIIKTADGALTFSSVESGWGSDHCGALAVMGANAGGARKLMAVRNKVGGADFHVGYDDALTTLPISSLPFQVNQDAMTVGAGGTKVAVGAKAVGLGEMVLAAESPFAEWTDITDDYPTDGEVRSLAYL